MQLPIQISVRYWTDIEEEWNKMSEEFILKACKSFRRRVDTIIEKNGGHIEEIYYFVFIFFFCCLFFKSKLILFYNRVVYYTRIFLISLPRPVHGTCSTTPKYKQVQILNSSWMIDWLFDWF